MCDLNKKKTSDISTVHTSIVVNEKFTRSMKIKFY